MVYDAIADSREFRKICGLRDQCKGCSNQHNGSDTRGFCSSVKQGIHKNLPGYPSALLGDEWPPLSPGGRGLGWGGNDFVITPLNPPPSRGGEFFREYGCPAALLRGTSLNISLSSAAELQSHFYVAMDRKYVMQETFDWIYQQAEKVGRMDSNLLPISVKVTAITVKRERLKRRHTRNEINKTSQRDQID